MNSIYERFRLVIALAVLGTLFIAGEAAGYQRPCCEITSINNKTGVVTAKVDASGQIFQFRGTNAAQLNNLKVGQPIYANLTTRQVSLDGRSAFATITNIAAATSAGSQPTSAA